MLLQVITRIYQVSPVSPLVWSISIGQNCGPYKRALLSYYRPICTYCVGSDGSIKSQSAAAVAKKRFLQIRSDALLRLFVSRQVDPASLPPTITAHTFPKATWVSVGGIPLAGFQPFPTSPFPRSRTPDLLSAVKEFMGTTKRTRQSRRGSNLVAFGDKA